MNPDKSANLFKEERTKHDAPVECLGQTFSSDDERRKYFIQKLKDKLHDPAFRKIEGFPLGTDEDILALSDPPYYCACPNPFIDDFIKCYGKPYDEKTDDYRREPFAADISEGKNDPIYNAHSYHTKVPHKAIMRYILHYTEPGDIVFDGFCGTGMTGVAAQACANPDPEFKAKVQKETPEVKWGARRAILGDLCPAATFIAYNYNSPVDATEFEREARRILEEVEQECGWMYETKHTDGLTKGRINYTVCSDIFICSACSREIVFWATAIDAEGNVEKEFPCPHCGASCTKRGMQRAFETKYDIALKQTVKQTKQVPVLINYSVGRTRYEKKPDKDDMALLKKIDEASIPFWFPTDPLPKGDKTGEPLRVGITHAHHFYTKRNLWILACFGHEVRKSKINTKGLWPLTAVTEGSSRLNRERPNGLPSKLSGTLYVSAMIHDLNVIDFISRKIAKYQAKGEEAGAGISTHSSTEWRFPDNHLDYIFVDPPFGSNLMYSELNFLWEAWLKVLSNNKEEAIINKVQKKGLPEYQHLMEQCFAEFYRMLKPGRWMTVEFHNSANSVWNSIQEALQQAGFVVADVRTFDKQQGSFNQVTASGAVKQDLIISAYKPVAMLERKFDLEAGTAEGAWDFIREHLKQLPIFVGKDDHAEAIAERQAFMLFDRMVAFHVQHGVLVPLSAAEFYGGLAQKFPERDGMFFLPEQANQYDKKRMTVKEFQQLTLIVKDESSAIQWLRQTMYEKPQTFQELQPQFMREVGGWQKSEKPMELKELLEDNFLCYDSGGDVPSQIHAYLSHSFHDLRSLVKDHPQLKSKAKDRWYIADPNKEADLMKMRERSLLKDFEAYKQSTKKLKVFRIEAVRAGFRRAWGEKDYQTIISVTEKLPTAVVEEDQSLLMWYTNAQTRLGGV
jgi:DNA modification methylase/DNA-directed RNA polymerase subunit RPC12/RpoP